MLNEAQQKYLNGTALQELMRLNPNYDESRKRAIYEETIDSLSIFIVEEYWRLKHQQGGN